MDVTNAGDFAEVLGELRQVAKVYGFDDEIYIDDAVYGRFGVERPDVGAVFGDDGGELFEEAGAVVADYR